MKRLILIGLLFLCFSASSQVQSDTDQVKEVVSRMFRGMQLGDSAMVRSVFHDVVTLATAFRSRDDKPVLRRESSIQDFLNAVGTPHPEPWNEEIWNVDVKIDGDFAAVWCDFAFYVGKKFSHCGINTFQLHKENTIWKIFHLADTRKSTGCDIPIAISDKYK
jgi:hypothetical protein